MAQAQRSSSKRQISSAAAASGSPKRAKRQSPSAKPASTSKYFRNEGSKDLESSSDQELNEEFSEFEEVQSDVASTEEDEDDDDEFDDNKPRRSRQNRNQGRAKNEEPTPRKGKGKTTGKLRAKDLSKPGVKTGLGPGTQVVIKKPKARDAGDTPYSDETIHPNTMLFLKDLAANNNRQWMKSELFSLLPQKYRITYMRSSFSLSGFTAVNLRGEAKILPSREHIGAQRFKAES